MSDDKVQVYISKGRLVIRARPSCPPTEGQLRAREAFKSAAKKGAGMRRVTGLPPAAAAIFKEMAGLTFGRSERPPKWKTILLSLFIREGYSREEATLILEALEV